MNGKRKIPLEHKCAYLGCRRKGRFLDDVETAPGVIKKKMVCGIHRGQLTKHISRTVSSQYMFAMESEADQY